MAAEETLKVVPAELKVLVQMIARTFYAPEHIVILDALIRHPCIPEEDLIDVLCLEARQLRQALHHLKKEKLVKSIQKNETEDGKTYRRSYHYINYQLFVNVAKYKFDQMRKKIKSETKEIQNRMSYICPDCHSSYSDMEADRLFDPMHGIFRCTHCGATLEDDIPKVSADSQNKLKKLNNQLSPIEELLRKADTYTLDPSLLEPDPDQTKKGLVELKKMTRHKGGSLKTEKWATGGGANIYGSQAGINVSIGDSNAMSKVSAREQPEWLRTSTVVNEDEMTDTFGTGHEEATSLAKPNSTLKSPESSHGIMADLLLHESQQQKFHHSQTEQKLADEDSLRYSPGEDEEDSESSSSDDEPGPSFPQEVEDNDSEDEQDYTMKIGDSEISVLEVTPDMVVKMTPQEKETYTELYREAYAAYYQ